MLRLKLLFVFVLAQLFPFLAQAVPSYVGEYKYFSDRCGSTYGPFTSAGAAAEFAKVKEYLSSPNACGASLTGSVWATQSQMVPSCWGGINYPVYTEGVESSNWAKYTVSYTSKAADGICYPYEDGLSVHRTRVVCTASQVYYEDTDNCDSALPAPGDQAANPKNNGESCPKCGDPINPANGNNWRIETDYSTAVPTAPLSFIRTYNSNGMSADRAARITGARWTTNWDRKLVRVTLPPLGTIINPCYRRPGTNHLICLPPPKLPTGNDIYVTRSDGKGLAFRYMVSHYEAEKDVNAKLEATFDVDHVPTSWTYTNEDGDVEQYDANGQLLSVTSRAGATQRLTYSEGSTNDTNVARVPAAAPVCSQTSESPLLAAGKLLCVTDNWNRQLNFEYDSRGRVKKIIDPAGREFLYGYDGVSGGCDPATPTSRPCNLGNLTSVTFPGGKSKTYWYNEAAQINGGLACTGYTTYGTGLGHLANALTGMTDENGVRFSTWTYDCLGRATSNVLAGNVAKVTIGYGAIDPTTGQRSNGVTTYMGTAANTVQVNSIYEFKIVQEVARNTVINQPCHDCGPIASRTYDNNGNLLSVKDWKNVVTSFVNDTVRNLQVSRTEAVGTPQQRKISTEWHATFRLPARIAEANRLTVFDYDAQGTLKTKTVRATTDTTGALGFDAVVTGPPRIWRYTYNAAGQVLTVTGPRTDVLDKTTYDYDTAGNLTSVTNPAGHQVTLSNFDADGRAWRVTDANGLATEFTYSPRGWLTSSSTGGEMTTYTYDDVGQLKTVSKADGTSVSYSYDPAQRLIGISDNLGNSITYTLDLVGNRLHEEVRDPGGTLARKTSRVFDTLNRVKQITGAQQ